MTKCTVSHISMSEWLLTRLQSVQGTDSLLTPIHHSVSPSQCFSVAGSGVTSNLSVQLSPVHFGFFLTLYHIFSSLSSVHLTHPHVSEFSEPLCLWKHISHFGKHMYHKPSPNPQNHLTSTIPIITSSPNGLFPQVVSGFPDIYRLAMSRLLGVGTVPSPSPSSVCICHHYSCLCVSNPAVESTWSQRSVPVFVCNWFMLCAVCMLRVLNATKQVVSIQSLWWNGLHTLKLVIFCQRVETLGLCRKNTFQINEFRRWRMNGWHLLSLPLKFLSCVTTT